jgi:hypothetical protein
MRPLEQSYPNNRVLITGATSGLVLKRANPLSERR